MMKDLKDYENIIREQKEIFSFFSEFETIISSNDLSILSRGPSFFHQLLNNYLNLYPLQSKLSIAKKMNISQGRLYELINGRRMLTSSHLESIKNTLNLSSSDYSKLRNLVEEDRTRQKKLKQIISEKITRRTESKREKVIIIEEETNMNSWIHYAVLSLFEIDFFVNTRSWIAQKLSISLEELNPIIDSLLEAGYLKEADGYLTYIFMKSSMSKKGENRRELTLSQIDKTKSIYQDLNFPLENNKKAGYGGYFFSGDSSKIYEASKMLDEALVKIAKYLEEDKKDVLYSLTYQLAPLTDS